MGTLAKVIGYFFLGLVGIAIIGVIAGSGDDGTSQQSEKNGSTSESKESNTSNSTDTKTTEQKPELALTEHDFVKENQFSSKIKGTIKNNTSRSYDYVQVSFNLYDESGAQIGTAMANVNNFEPKGRWKFEAQVLEDNVDRYKLKDITKY